MYTTKQVAALLGVSPRTVTNLVSRGLLNASVKFRQNFGYSKEDVDNYLKSRKDE